VTGPQAAALQIARRALAQRAGPHTGAGAIAVAARRAYDDLIRVSAPLIGEVGLEALTGRALHLAQRSYPWLIPTPEPEQSQEAFAHFLTCLEKQEPAVAAEAAEAVFSLVSGLFVTFIGDSLTAGILKKAWPDAFADASTGEK